MTGFGDERTDGHEVIRAALSRMMDSDDLCKEYGARACEHVLANFNWNNTGEPYLVLFKSIVRNRATGRSSLGRT